MKNIFPLFLFFCFSCSHTTPQSEKKKLLSTFRASKASKASNEELGRSMQQAHFKEVGKDNKVTELFFATYERSGLDPENSFYEFEPSIIIKRSDEHLMEFLSWPDLNKYGWVSAAQLPSKGYYWGFLDLQVEGRGDEVLILWSKDSGRTWEQLSSLKKRIFTDEFYSFTVDEKGNGSATIKTFSDDGKEGFDVFSTNNFGETWSAPIFYKSIVNVLNISESKCSFSMKPTKKIPKDCAIPQLIK